MRWFIQTQSASKPPSPQPEGAEQASHEITALRKALHDETMKRLASAEAMRERAARAAQDCFGVEVRYDGVAFRLLVTEAIRVLPLAPEEPACP